MSAEKLVIDDEMIGSIRRYVRGIEVNDETLALDLIRELGHRPDYLWNEHTLAHFQEEIRHSRLAVRCKREAWENLGSRAWDERATERVREILAQPVVSQVTPEQERELARIVERHLSAIRA
jgi:trimethylamine--corrinoid protein Co-methyltransferase